MAACSLKQGLQDPYTLSIVFTDYLLCLLPRLNLLAGGFITLLCCNRAPVLNLCSLSVILHSKSYEHSTSQWAVELVSLPCITFRHNSCLPPGNSLQESTLISLYVCYRMNQTVVDHVVYWFNLLRQVNARQIAVADHHCVAPCNSITCELVIIYLSCNKLMSYQKVLNIDTAPRISLLGYSATFPGLSQFIWLGESNCKQGGWDSGWDWWRHHIGFAMHRWTGTQTHHIRIADRQCAVWYIILDLHYSCSCGKTSIYYVVVFSWSPVNAKEVQRRWRWYVVNSSSNMKCTIT